MASAIHATRSLIEDAPAYELDGRMLPHEWIETSSGFLKTDAVDHFDDHFFAHGHTYEAHPITLGPAVATIHEMQRLNLVERARQMGAYLGPKLVGLKEKHPSVGDVRGLGLFWAVELVKNRKTKQLLNTMEEKVTGKPVVVDKIAAEMMKNGVSVQAWISHFVIAPPLIIEKDEIDMGVAALDAALRLADENVEVQ